MTLSLSQLADKLSDVVEALPIASNVPNSWTQRLKDFFGTDPSVLPLFKNNYHPFEHPGIQLALEEYLRQPGRSAELTGIKDSRTSHSLADIFGFKSASAPEVGSPVQYVRVSVGLDRIVECVERGLYLIQDGNQRLAVCIIGGLGSLRVETVSALPSVAEQFFSELDSRIKQQNVYKGEILSISSCMDDIQISFQKLEIVPKEAVIFPAGLLEAVEQETIRFSQHREIILAAGFSLKRGLLLHGVPGTGKTTLIKYLLGKMKERTALLIHGNGTQHIKEVCKLARSVEPAIVVIEDVDLIAKERSYSSDERLLFELMNEMDGLTSDADILFILTTNRPEVLEPALSSRPGRIDQSIKIPLPDEDCRRRLLELYAKGCNLKVENMPQFVKKTKDASAAFIHELVRKALLFAVEEGGNPCIRDRHLDRALTELLSGDSRLNRSILGFHTNVLDDEAAPVDHIQVGIKPQSYRMSITSLR